MSKIILSYLFKTNLASFRSAIVEDNTSKICRILDIERDYINKQIDHNGNTALILAIEHASPLTIRLLLEQGAQPDQRNEMTCQTPLGIIASKTYEDYNSSKAHRTFEMAKILLDYGAYVDKPSLRIYIDDNENDYYAKETPLMTAVRKRNFPLAKLLVERKSNVNTMERQSKIRAIHLAITNGDESMYDLLEQAGALVTSIVTNGDNTLLHWFCYKQENDQYGSLLTKLLAKGCDIDAQNQERLTPLMIAVKYNMIETCRILLKNKPQMTKEDVHGNRSIDLASPASQCYRLLFDEENILQSQINPLNEKIIWKKRIHSTGRSDSESTGIDGKSSKTISSTGSKGEGSLRPSICSPHRQHNYRKHHYTWGKSLQTVSKQHVKNFRQKRARSAETRNEHAI